MSPTALAVFSQPLPLRSRLSDGISQSLVFTRVFGVGNNGKRPFPKQRLFPNGSRPLGPIKHNGRVIRGLLRCCCCCRRCCPFRCCYCCGRCRCCRLLPSLSSLAVRHGQLRSFKATPAELAHSRELGPKRLLFPLRTADAASLMLSATLSACNVVSNDEPSTRSTSISDAPEFSVCRRSTPETIMQRVYVELFALGLFIEGRSGLSEKMMWFTGKTSQF